jgi:2-keto-3-deoxy-L-rhamnonate aldolase RhmA
MTGTRAAIASRLRSREPLVGTVACVPDAALTELLCERRDFVWIDLEHGQLGAREAQVMAIAARAALHAGRSTLAVYSSDVRIYARAVDAAVADLTWPRT